MATLAHLPWVVSGRWKHRIGQNHRDFLAIIRFLEEAYEWGVGVMFVLVELKKLLVSTQLLWIFASSRKFLRSSKDSKSCQGFAVYSVIKQSC